MFVGVALATTALISLKQYQQARPWFKERHRVAIMLALVAVVFLAS
jgi:hypothetical protein